MNEWAIKTFYKSRAIRATIIYPDKRIRLHWALPVGDTVQIGKMAYKINNEDVLIQKGIPSYIFRSDRPEPINPFALAKSVMTAEDFNVAISAKVASEILAVTSGKMDPGLLAIAGGILATLAIIGVGYWLSTILESMTERIAELERLIKLLGGIA
jgi:hypothetical protein